MTTSCSWRYMLDRLGDRHRLVIPDLPGCGRSEPLGDRVLGRRAEAPSTHWSPRPPDDFSGPADPLPRFG